MEKEKKYSVCKYFDDYFERVIKSDLNLEEAKELKYSYADKPYTSYEIRLITKK